MKKQKMWKKFSKLNSLILTTIFIFSSLFALTGCSTRNIYSGMVYTQRGYDYIVKNTSAPILSDLYDEYGMANGTKSGSNNWGSINYESLFGYSGSYDSANEETSSIIIADDLSNFKNFYIKTVGGSYIIICSTRVLYDVELGSGENDGMIVGYENGQFYIRNRNLTGSIYGANNIKVTNLKTNSTLYYEGLQKNPIPIGSNNVCKFHLTNQSTDFETFTAYVFVGQTVGGDSLSEPISFIKRFYQYSHVNAIENNIKFDNASAMMNTFWQYIPLTSSTWNCHLTNAELASKTLIEKLTNKTDIQKRKEVFIQKYDEYLAMLIIKNILVGSGSLLSYGTAGQTLSAKYTTAMNVIQNYINGSATHQQAVDSSMEFFIYVTSTIGEDLVYQQGDVNYIRYSICSEIIGTTFFTLTPSTSTAVEKLDLSSPFFKNYVALVTNIITQYIGANNDPNSSSIYPSTKGYFLEKDGFGDEIVCSLSALFFSNSNNQTSLFVSTNTSFPDFTIFFKADEVNMALLKTYSFYLYYHKWGDVNLSAIASVDADGNIKENSSLIKINFDINDENDEFIKNLESGVIYVDVKAIFKAKNTKVELRNYHAYEDNPLNNGFISTVQFNKDNFVLIYDSNPEYYSLSRDAFDFVELILVPPSASSLATITIQDIMI